MHSSYRTIEISSPIFNKRVKRELFSFLFLCRKPWGVFLPHGFLY
ncbi:hypothetical protein BCE_0244 [Bacillus cereus ATCC 10987]|uniref:Uncharacterized protein n=1 Tax=Bacillus cereus (strain ATCC 10987 / NRS 248) TaxID=222523 RepID=Q73EW4_BACC1|nr:hypothetical protein BCE_0244 [Bacillus cereus ATCC 10987]